MTPIVIFLLLVFFLGLISSRLRRTVITGPMIFTAGGILAYLTWPQLSKVEADSHAGMLFAEIALVLVLFTDATRIRLREMAGSAELPARLLIIGMPGTILLGTVLAALVLTDLTIFEAAIVAVILAPTDAGLGRAVVNSPLVPTRIRQALNVEAGLNDGLSIPFLMLFVALAAVTETIGHANWISFAAAQIGLGILTGLAFGWAGGWLMHRASNRGWMTAISQQLCLLIVALLCWLLAEELGGNGFIAAFVGGMFVKADYEDADDKMIEFSEAWGELLNYGVFFLFGMFVVPQLSGVSPAIVLYALLSLTLVRMLPVALAMIGSRLKPATVLFLGWFGPRGLASIVLGLVFARQAAYLPGEPVIYRVVITTVLLSILAHGISAVPGIKWYARQVEHMDPDAPEHQETVEMPVRHRVHPPRSAT